MGGAQGGLAWVWTCMDSIGTIHRAMVLWPVGSTSLELTMKRGDRVDVLIDSSDSVRYSILCQYTELLCTEYMEYMVTRFKI